MAQRHAGCGARLQRLAGMDPVVKSVAVPCHLLAGLVALTCDQDQVTVMHLQHGVSDRRCAVGLDLPGRPWHQRGDHVRQDGLRVFAARVVAGEDHAISTVHGGRTHEWTFARIAVTAATHHAPELSATRQGYRTQGRQGLGQTVGCVCIVNQYQRITTARYDRLHAPRRGAQTAAGSSGEGQRRALAAQGGDHAKKIGDVVGTRHRAMHGLLLPGLTHFKGHAAVGHADLAGLQAHRRVYLFAA